MKTKLKTNEFFIALICLICCLVLTFGIMLGGSSLAYASEGEEALAPTIVSIGGNAVSSGFAGMPSAIVGEEYKDADGNNYKVL